MSEIRSYLPQDREKAAAVFLVGMLRSHPFLPEELWLDWYRRLFREQLGEGAHALLAEADGEIAERHCERVEGGYLVRLVYTVAETFNF